MFVLSAPRWNRTPTTRLRSLCRLRYRATRGAMLEVLGILNYPTDEQSLPAEKATGAGFAANGPVLTSL